MRAAVFHGIDQLLRIEDRPDPIPGAGEVVLRLDRCGICGTDLHITDGRYAPPAPAGSVLGHEYAGEVVALGRGVETLSLGDRVAAMPLIGCGACVSCRRGEPVWCEHVRPNFGGFGEYVATAATACLKLPDALSFADGALVEPLSVALNGVSQAGVLAGKQVLVMGAGPIGLGVLFWARRMGAATVTMIEGAAARMEIAYAMGADSVLPPFEADPASADAADPARSIAGAELPEIVFECVGKPGLLAQAIAFARPRGTIVSLGFCMCTDSFIPSAAAMKALSLHFPVAWSQRDFQMSIDALDSGAVEPRRMISRTVSLDDAPVAFEALRRPSSDCKVMIAL